MEFMLYPCLIILNTSSAIIFSISRVSDEIVSRYSQLREALSWSDRHRQQCAIS